MRYSPEGLVAFVETVAQGSFSGAARKLRKSQSTISNAIATLEADLGLTLFDRNTRYPQLTPQGQRILSQVKAILAASDALDLLANRLIEQPEPRLSFVLSDIYQPTHYEALLQHFAMRYPEIEFECLIAEGQDVIDLLQQQRAQIGMLAAQTSYPSNIHVARLPEPSEMTLFVSKKHPLAQGNSWQYSQLLAYRQLCLQPYKRLESRQACGARWSTPSYLMLLEMTEQGFGWSILPRWLVKQFSQGKVQELHCQDWPQKINMDLAWSKTTPPGVAGQWFIEQLLQPLGT